MTNSDWQKLSIAIRSHLLNGAEISVDIKEDHKGAFLALFNKNGKLISESRKMLDGLTDLVETVKLLCDNVNSNNINTDVVKECSIQLCVIKDVVHIKNPLDWNVETDGICFQWGNRYQGTMMPYDIARMDGDKIRILDRLCSRIYVPSSLWRQPEAMLYRVSVVSYK